MHCMTRISQQECRGILEQEETGENMSYTALYRKFRPDTFEDVKGQDNIVKTLRNQIKADRIGHAYLFCGTRGTGKTTVAKILARAVNSVSYTHLRMLKCHWFLKSDGYSIWRSLYRKTGLCGRDVYKRQL